MVTRQFEAAPNTRMFSVLDLLYCGWMVPVQVFLAHVALYVVDSRRRERTGRAGLFSATVVGVLDRLLLQVLPYTIGLALASHWSSSGGSDVPSWLAVGIIQAGLYLILYSQIGLLIFTTGDGSTGLYHRIVKGVRVSQAHRSLLLRLGLVGAVLQVATVPTFFLSEDLRMIAENVPQAIVWVAAAKLYVSVDGSGKSARSPRKLIR
jgi:hypothetical protein